MPGLFTDDAVIRRVGREPILLLGGGRALLMQLAHPAVAAGVAEHSRFQDDPLTRLRHTLAATSALIFGDDAEVEMATTALDAVHRQVRGKGYAASDPALKLWVYATIIDTSLRMYERFFRPLPPIDAARFHEESQVVADHLGIDRQVQPPDVESFRAYLRHMVGSLRVSDDARRLADAVLHPRLGWAVEPGLLLARQLTIGLLPGPLRRQYGLGWDSARQAALLVTEAASRQLLPRVPGPVRRAPTLLRAWKETTCDFECNEPADVNNRSAQVVSFPALIGA